MTDILAQVDTLLTDSWNSSNTNSRTPTVIDIAELKRVRLGPKDFIFIWELLRVPEDNAAGGASKKTITTIVIDIRTAFSRAHFVLMREEVRRILNTNQIDPFSDSVYDISDITEDEDMSHLMVNIWRAQIKFRVEQLNLTVP